MSTQRFYLALDCGAISTEEVRQYEKAPAYIRARAVWKLLYDQVMGKGGYLSIRTMMTYGHAYSTAYGENVPRERQLQAFHIMDRYRQEHGLTFVQLPEESIDGLFKIREEAMTKPATKLHVTPSGDIGALYEAHEPRVRKVDDTGERPIPIDPPFESIPLTLDIWSLCLDFGNREKLGEQCYQEVHDMLKGGSPMGAGAQRLLLQEHYYLVVLGQEIPASTKTLLTRLFLRLSRTHVAGFVQLPEELLRDLLAVAEELISQLTPTQPFTEQAGAKMIDVNDPLIAQIVPIAPPQDMTQLPKVKKSRPFLERFYLMKRLTYERSLTEMEQTGAPSKQKHMLTAVEQSLMTAAGAARKYRFANSAQALVHAMMEQETGTAIKMLPETAIFIEFTTSLDLGVYTPVAGLFFVSPLQAYRSGNYARLFSETPEGALRFWVLNVLEEDGDVLMNLIYDTDRHAWKLPEVRQCPDNTCKQIMSVEEAAEKGAFTIWQMCPKCDRIARYFSHWLPIALLAIAGEFAEEAEPIEREVTETIIRKEKRPNSGKYEEHKEEVHFKIVTFDASVKRKPKTEVAAEPSAGPSWLDLAIEQGTIVYVKRGFGKTTRHLDPQRNPRWKVKRDVSVRAYSKRIPMTVANLQKVITRVVASKFEQGEQV